LGFEGFLDEFGGVLWFSLVFGGLFMEDVWSYFGVSYNFGCFVTRSLGGVDIETRLAGCVENNKILVRVWCKPCLNPSHRTVF
jgi:hypothetical protein